MNKKVVTVFVISIVSLFILGCDIPMVGAPCVPETDNREYNPDLTATTYTIETRSVQCETAVCLTRTDLLSGTKASYRDVDQEKFSFCSCRCEDGDGNKASDNSDKYGGLCECPAGTDCEDVLKDIPGAPEKVVGSYCMPRCIAKESTCGSDEICSPSKDSEEPWKWKCKEFKVDTDEQEEEDEVDTATE